MDQLLIEIGKPIVKESWKQIMLAKGLPSAVKAIEEKKTSIEAVLADAHSLGSCSNQQEDMLHQLRHGREMIDDFLDKQATRVEQRKLLGGGGFRTEVRSFFSSSNQLVTRLKDAHRVKHIQRKLELIANNNAQIGTIVNMVSEQKMIQSQTGPIPNTDVIIGRDVERDHLITTLCNSSNIDQESLSIETIVGIGGQGKTTLAQYVYNDPRVIDCFEVRLWVFATPNIRLEELLEKIREHATNGKPPVHGMSPLQDQIVKAIAKKKILLVLDNIWDHDELKENWGQLRQLLKFGATGSKVLVTTRSKEVASILGSPDPYMLNDLTKENAWPLFQHFAFTSQIEPRVQAIGKEIFRMCPKIPLVLKVIGQNLKKECHTINHWRAFKDDLAEKSSFKGNEKIMGMLKLSYDRLNEKLKPCVLYCSLYPKGTSYDVDTMVCIWIALGYVKAEEYKSLEDEGKDYVQMLANRGFFEYVDKDEVGNIERFKMHDIIHDLLVSKCESRYKMVDSKTIEIDENISHVSFLYKSNGYEFDWDTPSSVCDTNQRLKSILVVDDDTFDPKSNFNHNKTFRFRSGYDKLIARFPSLKVLDIHGMGIEKVPGSLGKLIHLRYLDLSGNVMQELPNSITKLVNLLSLDLSNCGKLQELPKDVNKLHKLRHLRLKGCSSLIYMPKGLGKLQDLQTLDCFVVGQDKQGNVMGGLEELRDLKKLRGQLIIIVAVKSKYIVSQGRTAPLGRKDNLTELNVQFQESGKEDQFVLEYLWPQGEKLRRMKIYGYGGKKLPRWMLNDQLCCELPDLIDIWMTDHNKIHIESSSKKPTLEYRPWLRIEFDYDDELLQSIPGYSELKQHLIMTSEEVGCKLPKGDGSGGINLWRLSIGEQLATTRSRGQQQPQILFKTWFPNLKILRIRNVPGLDVLPEEFRELTFLEELDFLKCDGLKALPDWIDTFTSLKIIRLRFCPNIETLPHQLSNLSQLVSLQIQECSVAFLKKCLKPIGKFWPFIQHIDYINIDTGIFEEHASISIRHSKK